MIQQAVVPGAVRALRRSLGLPRDFARTGGFGRGEAVNLVVFDVTLSRGKSADMTSPFTPVLFIRPKTAVWNHVFGDEKDAARSLSRDVMEQLREQAHCVGDQGEGSTEIGRIVG